MQLQRRSASKAVLQCVAVLAAEAKPRWRLAARKYGPIALLAALWLLRRIAKLRPSRGRMAPGPPRSIFNPIGDGWEIYDNWPRLQYYYWDLVKTYGPTVRITVGSPLFPMQVVNIISSPENIKHVLKDNFDNYPKGKDMAEFTLEMTGQGIFGIDGEHWYNERKTASRIFNSDNMSTQMTNIMLRNFHTLLKAFKTAGKGGTVPVDIEAIFLAFTMDSFCEVGFGVAPGGLSEKPKPEWVKFAQSWDGLQARCPSRCFQPFWKLQRLLTKWRRAGVPVPRALLGPEPEILEMTEYADHVFESVVKQRMERGALDIEAASSPKAGAANEAASPRAGAAADTPKSTSSSPRRRGSVSKHDASKRIDLIELFLDQKPPPSSEQLKDTVKSLLLGGRDTTGATLTWTFYEISQSPEIERRLREEAADLPMDDAAAFYNFVKNMKYTEAVVRETIRLHTPVQVDGKTCLSDDVLPDGSFVRAGELIGYSPFISSRDPKLWGEDCLSYRPERWLEMAAEPSPYVFTAFQAGPRICLGKDLAILEAKAVTAMLMKAGVNMRWWPGTPAPTYKMAATLAANPPGVLMKITVDEAPFNTEDAAAPRT